MSFHRFLFLACLIITLGLSDSSDVAARQERLQQESISDQTSRRGLSATISITVASFASSDSDRVLEVSTLDTVGYVKRIIQDLEGIPPDQQVLLFAGGILQDNEQKLGDAQIKDGDTLGLGLCLRVTCNGFEGVYLGQLDEEKWN